MPIVLKASPAAAPRAAARPRHRRRRRRSAVSRSASSASRSRYFLVGFVFYATLYAAAGSMVNSEQEAQQAAMPVMLLLMSGWLLVNPVMLNPNSTLAVVLSWLPWSSPIIMPMRMGLTTVSPLEIAGSLLVAVIGCVAAVWLVGADLSRWNADVRQEAELRRSGEVDSLRVAPCGR